MSMSAGTTTPDFGESVVLTITGHSETPNSALLNGVSETIESGATSGSATVTMPPGTDFVSSGDHQYTPVGEGIPLTLRFPTEAEETVTVQLTPTSPYILTTASAGPYPSTSRYPSGTASGDKFLWRVTAGSVNSIQSNGVVNVATPPVTLERYWFPADLEMWTAKFTFTLQTVTYPSVPMLTEVVPIGDGVYVRRTVSGKVRALDVGMTNTYRIRVIHDWITEAERDQIITFYNNNRNNPIGIDPSTDAYSYSVFFLQEPRRESRSPNRFRVEVTMEGSKAS